MSSGLKQTLSTFGAIKWVVRETNADENPQAVLPALRQLINCAYTAGVVWTMTDIIEAAYFSLQNEMTRDFPYSAGFATLALFYGVMFAELWLRLAKNRIEIMANGAADAV